MYGRPIFLANVRQDAGANAFVACLKGHAALKMGILHAVYGEL